VVEIAPDGQWLTIAEATIGELTTVNHSGVRQTRRVHNGRVVDGPDVRDGRSNRDTFSADAEVFAAAKRAAVASGNPPAAE
jgi:hypothetical protein